MKAYIFNKAGGTENLIRSENDHPIPEANEVLVETKAVSINLLNSKSVKIRFFYHNPVL